MLIIPLVLGFLGFHFKSENLMENKAPDNKELHGILAYPHPKHMTPTSYTYNSLFISINQYAFAS